MTLLPQKLYAYNFTAKILRFSAREYLVINLLLFTLPLLLPGPQLLVGTLVNFGLARLAVNFKNRALLPAILLPALAAVLHGMLWGQLSLYLAALLPLIWSGNALYVLGIRYLKLKKWPGVPGVLLPAVFKSLLLYGGTLLLVNFWHFPQELLTGMGIAQLFTAAIGGLSSVLLSKFTFKESSLL